jgi:hypothetical protein
MSAVIISLILVAMVQIGAMARTWVGWKLSGEVFAWSKFWLTFIVAFFLVGAQYGITMLGSTAVLDKSAFAEMCYTGALSGWAADTIISAFVKANSKATTTTTTTGTTTTITTK